MLSVVNNQLPVLLMLRDCCLHTDPLLLLMSPTTVVSSVKLNDMFVPVFANAVVGQRDAQPCYICWDEKL